MTGKYNFTDDAPPQPFIPIIAYWDDDNKVPWALPHVYDYMEGQDAAYTSSPQTGESYNGRKYLTAYAKQQEVTFGKTVIVSNGGMPDSTEGAVSIASSCVTLGDMRQEHIRISHTSNFPPSRTEHFNLRQKYLSPS